MNRPWDPIIFQTDIFQEAWIKASKYILKNDYDVRNLIVQIKNIAAKNKEIHNDYDEFCKINDLKRPKQVAYTIFPKGIDDEKDFRKISEIYNRENGMFDRIKTSWGTYFRRFTHYKSYSGSVNQLEKIIEDLIKNKGNKTMTSAYSMVIPMAGSETIKPTGKPCLNYIAIQVLKDNPDIIGMLAVYRNHDFLRRAYGNYLGLCDLQIHIARATGFQKGPLTCISSRAYIDAKKRAFRKFMDKYDN